MLRCVVWAAALYGAWSSDTEHVVVLTDDTLNSFVSTNDFVLTEFYAPWCGHCKSLAPKYEEAAKVLKAQGAKTVLSKVDATEQKSSKEKFGVTGYPTLKFFRNGKVMNYSGERTTESIVEWVLSREKDPVKNIQSAGELEKLIMESKADFVVVSFQKGGSTKPSTKVAFLTAMKNFAEELTSSNHEFAFAHVANREVAKEIGFDLKASPSIQLHRRVRKPFKSSMAESDFEFDPVVVTSEKLGVNVRTSSHTRVSPIETANFFEEIKKFVNTYRFPLVGEITPKNYDAYITRGFPLAWLVVDKSKPFAEYVEMLTPGAKELEGELSVVWLDGVEYDNFVRSLGITKLPGLMIIDGKRMKKRDDLKHAQKFLLAEEFTQENVDAFFSGYKNGTLESFLKSEPVPEKEWQQGTVFVAVGSTFVETVTQEKGVLMEFYAPWCGHCKRMEPEYEALAEYYKDTDDVVIAKIDATANDVLESIKGFPTLIFYPADPTESRYRFDGDRTAEGMVEFLKKQGIVHKSPASLVDFTPFHAVEVAAEAEQWDTDKLRAELKAHAEAEAEAAEAAKIAGLDSSVASSAAVSSNMAAMARKAARARIAEREANGEMSPQELARATREAATAKRFEAGTETVADLLKRAAAKKAEAAADFEATIVSPARNAVPDAKGEL